MIRLTLVTKDNTNIMAGALFGHSPSRNRIKHEELLGEEILPLPITRSLRITGVFGDGVSIVNHYA